MEDVTNDELRRRIKAKEYIATPKKAPSEMTQKEALLWEKDCLNARLRITEDAKRRPGLLLRIQDIERIFFNEKVDKVIKQVYAGPFENEVDEVDEEEEPDLPVNSTGFLNESDNYGTEPDDIVDEPVEEVKVPTIEDEIENDPLFTD